MNTISWNTVESNRSLKTARSSVRL